MELWQIALIVIVIITICYIYGTRGFRGNE